MAASPASAPHVPAWKKLGLKLKYANEEPRSPIAAPDNGSAARKRRKPEADGHGHDHGTPSKTHINGDAPDGAHKKAKKRRLAESDASRDSPKVAELSHATNTTTAPDSSTTPDRSLKKDKKREKKSKTSEALPDRKSQAAISTPEKVPSLNRKKSVAFTPDTKRTDGDSAQQLFKIWAGSLNGQQSEQDPALSLNESIEATDGGLVEQPNKAFKKAKKEQRKAHAASESEARELPSYVTYLQHYHADKSTWKFNKKQQIDLLKNLFNLYRIPASCDAAIGSYVAGLQGGAARFRLQQAAQEALKESEGLSADETSEAEGEMSMDDAADRKGARDAVLRTQLKHSKKRRRHAEQAAGAAADEELEQKQLAKRHRAHAVLRALGEVEEPAAAAAAPPISAAAQPPASQKRTRNTKKRTDVSDDDDSSSSSSDDDSIPSAADSSDDSDDSDDDDSSVLSSSSSDTSPASSSTGESDSDSDSGSGSESEESNDSE